MLPLVVVRFGLGRLIKPAVGWSAICFGDFRGRGLAGEARGWSDAG
jgi:hypothetical protein